MQKKFLKFDNGKVRMSLLPPIALKAIARAYTYGEKKYNAWNWIKAPTWSEYYDPLQRHLNACWSGEDCDDESKLLHLAHAGCCLMMLLVFQICGLSKDDRQKIKKEMK